MRVPFKGRPALVAVTALFAPGAGRLTIRVGGRFLGRIELDRPERRLETVLLTVPSEARGSVAATVATGRRLVAVDAIGVIRRLDADEVGAAQ